MFRQRPLLAEAVEKLSAPHHRVDTGEFNSSWRGSAESVFVKLIQPSEAVQFGSRGPLPTDRVGAVPIDGGGPDRVEYAPARVRHMRHLDHRAGMALLM